MTLCLLILGLLSPTANGIAQPEIHPAFTKTPEQFESAWQLGISDAKRKAKPESRFNRHRRGIGHVRTNVLATETVSWVWYIAPELFPYYSAYQSHHQLWPQSEIEKARETHLITEVSSLSTVIFYGVISLYPSWHYGRIVRTANPQDLKDVRVVLKVGENVIQPIAQPGNMLKNEGRAVSIFSVPRYTYTTATASSLGRIGNQNVSLTTQATVSTGFIEHRTSEYTWYQGDFLVEFPLFDSKGTPMITESDKEMTLIVIYGQSRREARFRLRDLVNPLR